MAMAEETEAKQQVSCYLTGQVATALTKNTLDKHYLQTVSFTFAREKALRKSTNQLFYSYLRNFF